MSERNKAVVRRYLEEVFAKGDLDAIPEVFALDYVEHDPASEEEIRGHDGVRHDLATYQRAFSDLEITVEDQLMDADKVATRVTFGATHVDEFFGIRPTGERVSVAGIVIHRLADGKLAEGWWNWDTLGLVQQLGGLPAAEPA